MSRCSPVAEAEADLAPDGSSLAGRYHVEYYGYKPTFYDIGNTCSDSDAGTQIPATLQVLTTFYINILAFNLRGIQH